MNRCQWQWKVFFLQVVGMVTAVHWCIVFFSRLMGGLKRCVVWVQVHSVLSVWKEHCVIDQHHAYLNEPICEHTYMHKHTHTQSCPVRGSPFHSLSLPPLWLSCVAGDSTDTCGDPGTPAHASREVGTFKVRSKVRFTCSVGHTLYGSAERICFPNGTWSGRQPFCKRKRNLKWFCDANVPTKAQGFYIPAVRICFLTATEQIYFGLIRVSLY